MFTRVCGRCAKKEINRLVFSSGESLLETFSCRISAFFRRNEKLADKSKVFLPEIRSCIFKHIFLLWIINPLRPVKEVLCTHTLWLPRERRRFDCWSAVTEAHICIFRFLLWRFSFHDSRSVMSPFLCIAKYAIFKVPYGLRITI